MRERAKIKTKASTAPTFSRVFRVFCRKKASAESGDFILYRVRDLALFRIFGNNSRMIEDTDEVLAKFGKRAQRCYGCFVAYHLKDMYLGDDVTFFCEYCKDDTMFHFNDFAKLLDLSKLKEVSEADHHH